MSLPTPKLQALLLGYLIDWHSQLLTWALSGALVDAALQALELTTAPTSLRDLNSRLAKGDWSDLPKVELLGGTGMGGAIGAWASSTQTIYLNSDWLIGASKSQISAVLTEEFGHYLDSKLNKTDTQGDEGEYFSRILGGENLSAQEIKTIQTEDDAVKLILEGGQVIRAEAATITGGEGDDTLTGTNSADTISGRGGNDVLNGIDGNDIVYGGDGDDIIDGGSGNDTLWGGTGKNIIYGGNDSDSIYGGIEFDKLYGGAGNDYIDSGNFENGGPKAGVLDYIEGNDGSDIIILAQGDVYGGDGNDRITAYPVDLATYLDGGGGSDSIEVYIDINLARLNPKVSINAGEGDDTITIHHYTDILDLACDGGAGYDTLVFQGGGVLDEKFSGIEKYVLSGYGNYQFKGSASITPNHYIESSYLLTMDGMTQGDVSINSRDLLVNGLMFDGITKDYNSANLRLNIQGSHQDDYLILSDGSDFAQGNGGDDYINGGDGVDTAIFSGNSSDYTITEITYNQFQIKDNRSGSPDGTDTIVDVNKLQFANGTQDVVIVGLNTSNPTYTITPSSASINEGATLTTTVSTTNVASGTTLYYSLSGTGITASDFSTGALTGSGTVASNGSFTFTHVLANDLTTEGSETLAIKLFSDAARTVQIGTTASVTVADTSKSVPTFAITPSASSINEGATLTTTVSTTNVAAGTTLYYSLSGTGITTSDFSSGALTGSGAVASNGSFIFTHVLANDLKTEGTEVIAIKLFSDAARTVQIGTTASVTVADTSKSVPTFAITPSASSINEGATLTTTVSTTNVAAGTTLYYSLSGTGITPADFSSGALTGSGAVASNGSFIFTHVLANDLTTEGTETLAIKLFTDASLSNQIGTTTSVTVADTSKSVPTYAITPSTSSINEGATLTTTVSTTNVAAGTTLYYSLSGTGITASDFSSGALTGSGAVAANGSFSFTHVLTNDLTTEGTETLAIKLFTDAARTAQVGTTASITVADTSKSIPTYAITPSTSNINEGATLTTTVSTTNVATGTTLYYSLSGTGITASDFSSGALTGSGTVAANGSFSFTHVLANDLTTEGSETLAIKLFTDAALKNQVGTTASVTVADTSKSVPTYTITPSAAGINEGATLTTTVNTTNVAAGTTLYYSLSGTGITAADFTSGALTGSGTVAAKGSLTFTHVLANDLTTEGTETLAIKLFSDAALSNQIGTTASVTVADTSKSVPTYAITPSATSINEGAALTTTVSTTNVPTGTTLYYSLSGTGITASDFSSGALTSSGTVASNGSFTFTHVLANDLTTEGSETLAIKLFTDAALSKQVGTTASVTVVDTSKSIPTYTITPSSASINEGATLTTTVSTTNVAAGTTLYYSLSGTGITASDFSSGALTGSGAVASNGSFIFTHVLANDLTTEGTEVIAIKLFSDAARTVQVGTTASITVADSSTDTLSSSSTTTLDSTYKNLILTGSSPINGTGNDLNNAITGNAANNILYGRNGADILTGLGGADTFKYAALGESLLASFDRITDFAIGTDILDAPNAVSATNIKKLGGVKTLDQAGISSVLTSSLFGTNQAATFSYGSGTATRTFLALNDSTAGFNSNSDAIIEFTGYSGLLTNLAIV